MFAYDMKLRRAAPFVHLRIRDNRRGVELPRFPALIDSGADCSCIPRSVVEQSGLELDYEIGTVRDHRGRQDWARFVRMLDATLEFMDEKGTVHLTMSHSSLRLLVITDGLVGRDILNQYFCGLDGPGLSWSIR